MPTNPKMLFTAVPGTSDGELTSGPGASKVWVITNLHMCNTNAADKHVTVYRRRSAVDRYICKALVLPAGKPNGYGPLVMENGDSLRGLQETASAVEITAFGYETDVEA